MESINNPLTHLIELVANTLKIDSELISLESGPLILSEWDSHKHILIMIAIEDKYGVEFDADEISTMISIQDILNNLQYRGLIVL